MDLIDLGAPQRKQNDFTSHLSSLCDALEFDFASYCAINTLSNSVQGFATFADSWKEHYAQNRMQTIDPTIGLASRSIAPVDWERFRSHEGFHSVFDDAGAFGISDRGLTVPIRGPYGECGLLSVTRDCKDREWDLLKRKVMPTLQTAAVAMHDGVMRSDALAVSLRRPTLSEREREVLQWIAAGKTQMDVGDILSISGRTVEVHLRSARSKLCALTTAQAVGRGISMGLIHPS